MHVDLSALAYAARLELVAEGLSMKLGHAQELVAAALGYRTFAALQAALPSLVAEPIGHIVLDGERVRVRASDLGHPMVDWSTHLARSVGAGFPGAKVHRDEDEFAQALRDFVDSRTAEDSDVVGQTAMTNGWLHEVYMPLDLDEDLASQDEFSFDISGHVSMEQDPDKVYWGHKVMVEATLTFRRLSERCFTHLHLAVTQAELLWGGEEPEEEAFQQG